VQVAPGECIICHSLPETEPDGEVRTEADLNRVLSGLAGMTESAQCRLDDLVVALRTPPEAWLTGEDGYLLIVLAREAPAAPPAAHGRGGSG
jgi:hypothetical protein